MRALLAPGRADPRRVRQRWLVRHGGAATEDARRAVVKLLVDAARQTSVERRILALSRASWQRSSWGVGATPRC